MAARVAATAMRMQSHLQNAGERAEQVQQNTGSRRLRRVAGAAAGLLRGTARFASQVADIAAQQAVPAPTAPSMAAPAYQTPTRPTATPAYPTATPQAAAGHAPASLRADPRPAAAASSGSQQQPARPTQPHPSSAQHHASVNTAQSRQAAGSTASTAPRQPGASSASASTHRAESRSSDAAERLADRESNPELYARQTAVGIFFKHLVYPFRTRKTQHPVISEEEKISRIKKIAENPELAVRIKEAISDIMQSFIYCGGKGTYDLPESKSLKNMDLRIAVLEAIHDLPYVSNQMTEHGGRYFFNPPDLTTFADRLARIEAAAETEETIFPGEPIPTAEMPASLIEVLINKRMENIELQVGLGVWRNREPSWCHKH
jgi:hypothetical protein